MEFAGNSPDLKNALAHPVKPKGGPRAVLETLEDAVTFISSVKLRQQTWPCWDRCAREILKAARTGELQRRVDLLPRLSAGITKIDVVMGQHRKAAAREVLRVLHDRALFHARHAMTIVGKASRLPLVVSKTPFKRLPQDANSTFDRSISKLFSL